MPFFTNRNNELRILNTAEKQIIYLTIFGSFFSCLDFTVYVFFKEVISSAFFPENLPDWLKEVSFWGVVASGYVFRPIGGIVLGDYGDRYGRKPILMLSLGILSISTLAIGLLPSFAQVGIFAPLALIAFRCIQGFAYGAEVPASWVYVAEHLPRTHIGVVCSMVISSTIVSLLFCNFLYHFLASMLKLEDMVSFGWRLPFILGSIGTVIAIMLRKRLPETKVWLQAYAKGKTVSRLPIRVAFAKYRYGVFTTLMLSWFISSLFIIVLLIIPNISIGYLDMESRVMNIANGLGTLFGALGAVVFGVLADRFNVGKVLIAGCIALAIISITFFHHADASGELVFLLYSILGFCFGVIGVVPSIFVQLFPVEVRFSGVSFCYNITYGFTGALTPILLGIATTYLSLAPALYIVFICVIGIMAGIFLTNLQGLHGIEDHERSTSLST